MKRCGLIINPIAGMGGSVGLKGTDGKEILEKSIALGAEPHAGDRAALALEFLKSIRDKIQILTCPGPMGENVAREAGFDLEVISAQTDDATSSTDTIRAAKVMVERGVDLILFAGGDGTARDMVSAVGTGQVVIGIPAGVKIHSAVYAQNPERAGELTSLFLQGKTRRTCEAEVMDINEDDYRNEILSARLYGYLTIPFKKTHMQNLKCGSPANEKYAQEAIAADVVESMSDSSYYIIGAGSTTRPIMERLGLDHSLLGIDIVHQKQLVGKDLGEKQILELIQNQKTKLVITPIGGQGYLLGRGNQQISPEVIHRVGKDNIIIVSTPQKIQCLFGQPLLVDTGNAETNTKLKGHYRIITGYHESVVYRVTH